MWGGRFEKEPDLGFMEFSYSIGFDVRLYPYDIGTTIAWSKALAEAGVMTTGEEEAVLGALASMKVEFDSGSFQFAPTDEDIHTAIERRLVELVGPAGGKVRTGRSRNDQVATDLRLLVMDACWSLVSSVKALQSTLVEQAEANLDLVIPGHTHLQQAQPVLLAHVLLAFVQMFERDVSLLLAAAEIADSMPLGSGALAGTTIEIDRQELAHSLGFSRATANSIDAVSDRDFACAALFALSMAMVHLSRLAEQVVLWCSQEFGIATLDDSWATGSSLMPQKKNPDGPELVRGKSGRVFGSLVSMLIVLKGLPLSYNRDLQEDKEGLFDALDTTAGCLAVMERTIATMTFDSDRAAEHVSQGFMTATDLADYLSSRGMEFPQAHRVVGEVVSYCLSSGKELEGLTAGELAGFSELLDEAALECLGVDASLSRRSSAGGTAPAEVARQLAAARQMISGTDLLV
jgi:argininosuccinate lyase